MRRFYTWWKNGGYKKLQWFVGLPVFIGLIILADWYTNNYTMKEAVIEVRAIESLNSCKHFVKKRIRGKMRRVPCALVTTSSNLLQLKKTHSGKTYGHEDAYKLLFKLKIGCRYAVSIIGTGPIPQTFDRDTKHQIVKAHLLTENQIENCNAVASR